MFITCQMQMIIYLMNIRLTTLNARAICLDSLEILDAQSSQRILQVYGQMADTLHRQKMNLKEQVLN